MLYMDASDNSIGAVLYQCDTHEDYRVIPYVNRTLKRAEREYFTFIFKGQEILTNKFCYNLYGKRFEIHMDNQALSFLLRC